MKASAVQIEYDADKLSALRQYMPVESALKAGLENLLQELYEKHVPAEVREYIESRKD
ncbi:MAG TPA: DUF6103 family protein [Spirochaetales bacterium]|nr:DUF6103 family protein [Spirochaetales bacterium]